MVNRLQKYILFFVLALLLFACRKTETFPPEPNITAISLTKIPNNLGFDDKGILKISFTDGDGDLGLSQEDTLPPFNQGSEFYYNFFISYFEKQNGQWVKIETNPPIHARIPPIVPDVADKALIGDIEIELEINNYFSPYDTICFETYIVDRALNKSNVMRTTDIRIKKS